MSNLNEEGYLQWKDWTSDQFGKIDSAEFAYFDSELAGLVSNPTANVLEMGFGEGSFLGYCKKKGYSVTGVELNRALVQVAQGQGFNVFHTDDTNLLPKSTFDLIVLFDVMEHIPQDEAVDFLMMLGSLLVPGGKILMRFPNADSWLGNINQNGDVTHVMQLGYHKLVYLTQQSGLAIEDFRAERRRGFASGFGEGIYMIVSEVLRKSIAAFLRLAYFRRSPIVLTSINVVAVLRKH